MLLKNLGSNITLKDKSFFSLTSVDFLNFSKSLGDDFTWVSQRVN